MQRVEIDCRAGKTEYLDLTTIEIDKRLQEIEQEREERRGREKQQAKKQLSEKLAQSREMKLNRDIFTQADLNQIQNEIDLLRGVL